MKHGTRIAEHAGENVTLSVFEKRQDRSVNYVIFNVVCVVLINRQVQGKSLLLRDVPPGFATGKVVGLNQMGRWSVELFTLLF